MNRVTEAKCPAPPMEGKKNVYEMLCDLEDQQMKLWGMVQEIRNRQHGTDVVEPNVINVNGYFERLVRLIDINNQLLTLMDDFLTYF